MAGANSRVTFSAPMTPKVITQYPFPKDPIGFRANPDRGSTRFTRTNKPCSLPGPT